jgi:acyl carrier protein
MSAPPTIEELLARVLDVDKALLSDASGQANLATWDSLRHLEVIAALQETYGVRLSAREILDLKSIGSAREVLRRRGVPA